MKLLFSLLTIASLAACTTGRLEYITKEGERKFACETEYTWAPSVDKFAVEYILSYCAQQASEKGFTVVDKSLLELDLSVPNPPEGKRWSHELAKELYQQKKLSDKEYGYIIAYLDLEHDKLN
ncbi:hypothetical protein FLL45_14650 [Aliikangiella marina]|uniref:Lipoprotein n=1 Tax=Aliikangiella marina TaxID=1712262 RepID=A0A545TA49_9GAMM|nr:hypothetical protein [Aliikangiella marina]TQV74093.1 hypothetical protein FLL45_14650 [Aliikangiella marina]